MHAVVDADKPGKPLGPEGLFLYKALYYTRACPGPRVRKTQILFLKNLLFEITQEDDTI